MQICYTSHSVIVKLNIRGQLMIKLVNLLMNLLHWHSFQWKKIKLQCSSFFFQNGVSDIRSTMTRYWNRLNRLNVWGQIRIRDLLLHDLTVLFSSFPFLVIFLQKLSILLTHLGDLDCIKETLIAILWILYCKFKKKTANSIWLVQNLNHRDALLTY